MEQFIWYVSFYLEHRRYKIFAILKCIFLSYFSNSVHRNGEMERPFITIILRIPVPCLYCPGICYIANLYAHNCPFRLECPSFSPTHCFKTLENCNKLSTAYLHFFFFFLHLSYQGKVHVKSVAFHNWCLALWEVRNRGRTDIYNSEFKLLLVREGLSLASKNYLQKKHHRDRSGW